VIHGAAAAPDAGDAPTAPRAPDRWWRWPWRLVALAAFGGGIVLLARGGDGMWFVTDEWAFLLRRRDLTAATLLQPHNEHWSTFTVLAYRALFEIGGLTSYRPYLHTALALHAGATGAGWWLLRRLGVPRLPALLAAVALLLMGAAVEQLYNAFQLSWTAPLLLVLVAWGLLERARPRADADAGAAALLLLAMPWSGVALALVAGTGAALVVRGRWGRAFLVTAPALAAYALWRALWGVSPPLSAEALARVPAYVGYGLTSAVRGFTGLPAEGAVAVLVLLGAGVAVRAVRGGLPLPSWAALFSVLAFFASAGLARVLTMGVEQAASSRYLHLSMLLLLLVAAGASAPLWRGRAALPATVLAAALLAACAVVNVTVLERAAEERRLLRGTVAGAIETADDLLAEGLPAVPAAMPEPLHAPDVTAAELLRLQEEGVAVDFPGPLPPVARREDELRFRLQVAFTPVPEVTGDLAVVGGTAELRAPAGACADVVAEGGQTLELRADGRLGLRATGSDLLLHVRRGGSASGLLRAETLRAGEPRQLELAVPADPAGSGALSLGFPEAGTLRLCGATLVDQRAPAPAR